MAKTCTTGLIAFVIGLAGTAIAAPPHGESFLAERAEGGVPVSLPGELFLPSGRQGPVPAMVIVHGSGGPSSHERLYAQELAAMNVAAVVVNYFAARGVASTVEDQLRVPLVETLGDAYAVLAQLTRDPRIDPARIGVVGFSRGGSVALDSAMREVADQFAPAGPRFALHVAFYPGCVFQYHELRTTGAPLTMLVAGDDQWVGAKPCIDYAEELKAAGANLKLVVYPGAQHAWDFGGGGFYGAGQNVSKCIAKEQADGSWIARDSGIRFADAGGRVLPAKLHEALRSCATRGVRTAADTAVRDQACGELRSAIRNSLAPD